MVFFVHGPEEFYCSVISLHQIDGPVVSCPFLSTPNWAIHSSYMGHKRGK